jgi:hypothetical protein
MPARAAPPVLAGCQPSDCGPASWRLGGRVPQCGAAMLELPPARHHPRGRTTVGCSFGCPGCEHQRSTGAALLSDQRTALPMGPMLGYRASPPSGPASPRSLHWWRRPRRGRMRGAFLRRGRLTPDGSGECRDGRCDAGHTRSRPGRHGTLAPTAGRGCRRATTPPTFGSTTVEHGRSRSYAGPVGRPAASADRAIVSGGSDPLLRQASPSG